jgi:hypothetical protein
LIGSSRFGWYKIGMSKKVAIRVEDIGVLLPFKIEVFAVWMVTNPQAVEAALHERFSRYSINGEWFSFDRQQLRSAVYTRTTFGMERIFPGDVDVRSLSGFSNMPEDIVQATWTTEPQIEYRSEIGFMDLVKDWLEVNGLDYTRENRKAARDAVVSLFREKRSSIKAIVKPSSKKSKPAPGNPVDFPALMEAWLVQEGLEPTSQNKNLARNAVQQSLKESREQAENGTQLVM